MREITHTAQSSNGHRISVPSITSKVPVEREIVGVVRQIAIRPGEVERPLEIYVPLAQNAWGNAMLAVRTDREPAALMSAIKAAIARVDRNQVSTLRIGRLCSVESATPHAMWSAAAHNRRLTPVVAVPSVLAHAADAARQPAGTIRSDPLPGPRPRAVQDVPGYTQSGDVMGAARKGERLIDKASASDLTPEQAVAQYVARLNAQYGGSAIAIGVVRGMIDAAMGNTTLTGILYKSRNEDAT